MVLFSFHATFVDLQCSENASVLNYLLFRQNEGTAPVRPSSAVGELPPLERTGSPTGAEKDILVCLVH